MLELLDALGIGSAALVGASYGGRIALEIAARRPDRVNALALICAGRPGHEPGAELRALGRRENELIEAAVRASVRQIQRQAYELQPAADEEFEPIRAAVDLAAVRAPCLALAGGHDLIDYRQIAAELPDLLGAAQQDTRHLELPWAGHLPSMERPSAVTDLLVGFLHETLPVG